MFPGSFNLPPQPPCTQTAATKTPSVGFQRIEPVRISVLEPVSAFRGLLQQPRPEGGNSMHVVSRSLKFSNTPTFAHNRHGDTWREPGPRNLPRPGVGKFAFAEFPEVVLQLILSFLSQSELADIAVLVNRTWCGAIRRSTELNGRRFAFNYSGVDYDGQGILSYLGRRSAAAATMARFTTSKTAGSVDLSVSLARARNPALALRPQVRAWCASFDGAIAPSALAECLCGGSVGRFVTDKMPFAWVGVDLLEFGVVPTWYTLGGSTDADDPYPLQWELQATTTAGTSWDGADWVVLDRQMGDMLCRKGPTPPSKTFQVTAKAQPFRRFRIVQTSANSHWGHELAVSGLELYGTLHRVV
jgi:hypothetical protein